MKRSRRSFLLGAAAVLAGCAGPELAPRAGAPAVAPRYRVGDRWIYHAQDGFRLPVVWEETQEVIAVGASGVRVRFTQKGSTVDSVREELWRQPGLVAIGAIYDNETRRFDGTLRRCAFPLEPGSSWNQRIANYNDDAKREGEISFTTRVGGWTSVSTPAGTFEAIQLRTIARLDDDDFWRNASECNYVSWYAPAARNFVRDLRDAQYVEKSGPSAAVIRSQHAVRELVALSAA